jgi:hypothetical protein
MMTHRTELGYPHIRCGDRAHQTDAPGLADQYLENKGKPGRCHETGKHIAAGRPEDETLGQHAEQRDDRKGGQHGKRKRHTAQRIEHIHHVGAAHEKLAMGEIGHLHDAECQRQTHRNRGIDRAEHNGIGGGLQKCC